MRRPIWVCHAQVAARRNIHVEISQCAGDEEPGCEARDELAPHLQAAWINQQRNAVLAQVALG
jgi:hypothetical protein